MTLSEVQLELSISEADADAEWLDNLTGYLANDLVELGVQSITKPGETDVPDGAKGDAFTLGALALVSVPALLPSLLGFLQAWTLRGESRTVTIKTPAGLEVTFAPEKRLSESELLALVNKLSVGASDTPPPEGNDTDDRTRLRQFITKQFNVEELRTLCFDLNVEYENLSGESKTGKVRELIVYAERYGLLQKLLEQVREMRPNVPWQ